MFTPLVLTVTTALKRNPIPYLIGLATAANIGSSATITGNPQNMLIGISSGIPYMQFAFALAPVALIGLVIAWLVIVLIYRPEFAGAKLSGTFDLPNQTYQPLMRKSLALTVLMLAAFLLGAPIALSALCAAAALLITRRLKPSRILAQVDWSILVFFSGLFVVTGALTAAGFADSLFALAEPIARAGVLPLTVVTALLSNLISNVPAVLLFRPLVEHFADPRRAWLTLAMASTLAGNLTLLGSVANLIVAEIAGTKGVKLTFSEYLRAGVPITLLTLAAGVLWLSVI
jgi:Na+/H+ antiporter NhaD/arsenite permease-like protein